MKLTETVESAEVTESTGITRRLQEAFTPLLQPNVQHFATQFNGKIKPTLEIGKNQIIIRNLPSSLTRDEIDASFIGIQCHRAKHLYIDGDCTGKSSIFVKLKKNEPLENNRIRMCLTYVYFLDRKSDEYQDVTINFLLTYDRRNPPRIIDESSKSSISNDEVKELRSSGYHVEVSKHNVTIWHEMTAFERKLHTRKFIALCHDRIQQCLDELFASLTDNRTECTATNILCLPVEA